MCRDADGDCDVAEYCTGSSKDCPADGFAPLGTQCGDLVDCPADGCNGFMVELYPADGYDQCDGAGNCDIPYSCEMENSYCSDNNPADGINTFTCGAQCDQTTDCVCPADQCIDAEGDGNINDFADYPSNGECNTECSCNIDTGIGQPCEPSMTFNDNSRCEQWSAIIPPEGVFEPASQLSGTHVDTFSIRFEGLTIFPSDELICTVKAGDDTVFNITATGLSISDSSYSLDYTLQEQDNLTRIVRDPDRHYLPWILKNCSIRREGDVLFKQDVLTRIYTHHADKWTEGEVTRAVSCINNPHRYFDNIGKCEGIEDVRFAMYMAAGNSLEDESCINNPGAGCDYDLCNAMFFPTCDPIERFPDYVTYVEDPNGYAIFTAAVGAYNTPVAYTRYVDAQMGTLKLRLRQQLTSKVYSITIANLVDVESVNVYGKNTGNGITTQPVEQPDGTFSVSHEWLDEQQPFTGTLDLVFNISFSQALDQTRALELIIAYGSDNNAEQPAVFDVTFSQDGLRGDDESQITPLAVIEFNGVCGDYVNNDFDYLGPGNVWEYSYDCFDQDCDGVTGDADQQNEFGLGKTGLCNYQIETDCEDEFDNDYDSLYPDGHPLKDYTDCHDADCFHNDPVCAPIERICHDGLNNDWDYTRGESEIAADQKIENNGTKYSQPTYTAGLIDCEDPDCNDTRGNPIDANDRCNWGYEKSCDDNFNNDAMQLKDCDLIAVASTTSMPTPANAEYDCRDYCRITTSAEAAGQCFDNIDNDWDAISITGYYSDQYVANSGPNQGIDCRWGGYFSIGQDYNPDEDCHGQPDQQGRLCELMKESSCSDGFDNDFDRDAAGMPGAGWNQEAYLARFGRDYAEDADCDDYDCKGSCPANEAEDPYWCFDGIDNDLDAYYFDGDTYVLDDSLGKELTDCGDPDCLGVQHPDDGRICLEKEYDPGDGFFTGLDYPGMYCGNDLDDDADGPWDCSDADCFKQFRICSPGPCYDEENITWDSCSDKLNNDNDNSAGEIIPNGQAGAFDCMDSDCYGMIGSLTGAVCRPDEACDDGFDNDADSLVDCRDHSDCDGKVGGKVGTTSVYCRQEESSLLDCKDGFDNDGDGYVDCYDPSCNSVCGLTDIDGAQPVLLPKWHGAPIGYDGISLEEAKIVDYTEQVRQGETYTIIFERNGPSNFAEWHIGTQNAPFQKDSFNLATANVEEEVFGQGSTSYFRVVESDNGFRIDSQGNSMPSGYRITFTITAAAAFDSLDYQLFYYEDGLGQSTNNNIPHEIDENIDPTASLIRVTPQSLPFGERVYIRAQIADNEALGLCRWSITGPDNFNPADSRNCRASFLPTTEGQYTVQVTPVDYYSNVGEPLATTYNLNIMPTPKSISTDKRFYRPGEQLAVAAEFNMVPTDTLSGCVVIARNAAEQISLGTIPVDGNRCEGTVSTAGTEGLYSVFVRATESTENNVTESDRAAVFVCSQPSGICKFSDFDGNGEPDICLDREFTIDVEPPLAYVKRDNYIFLSTKVSYENGTVRDITYQADYSSLEPAIASADNNRITANSIGMTRIRAAYTENEYTAEDYSDIVVTDKDNLSYIMIEPRDARIEQGLTLPYYAIAYYSNNSYKNITAEAGFSAQNTAKADFLQSDNIVTALEEGRTAISAEYTELGYQANATTTLTIARAGSEKELSAIEIKPKVHSIIAGSTVHYSLTAYYSDNSYANVTAQARYQSEDVTVATVVDNVATGIGDGYTVIYANYTEEGETRHTTAVLYVAVNRPPTQSRPVINSTLGSNFTFEDLTCYNRSTGDPDGDEVSNIYRWYKDGIEVPELRNLRTISHEETSEGDSWACSIVPCDRYVCSEELSSVNLTIRLQPRWSNVSYPEGIFEPLCCPGGGTACSPEEAYYCTSGDPTNKLAGTHLHRFTVTFNNITAQSGDVLECLIERSDSTSLPLRKTLADISEASESLSYTLTQADLEQGRISKLRPWNITECSVIRQGVKLHKIDIEPEREQGSRIFVHENIWTRAKFYYQDAYRAVKCYLGIPGSYFNNTHKCDWLGDVNFAVKMSQGASVEGYCHDGINNDIGDSLTDCEDPDCFGISYSCLPHMGLLGAMGVDTQGAAIMEEPAVCEKGICSDSFEIDSGEGHINIIDYQYTRFVRPDGTLKVRFSSDGFSYEGDMLFAINNLVGFNEYGNYAHPDYSFIPQGEAAVSTAYTLTTDGNTFLGDHYDFVMWVNLTGYEESAYEFELLVLIGQNARINLPLTISTEAPDNWLENSTSTFDIHNCNDTLDNDLDYKMDCSDEECHLEVGGKNCTGEYAVCEFQAESICYDCFDNNRDGDADCLDQDDCWKKDTGCPSTETDCSDGIDNDWDRNYLPSYDTRPDTGIDCTDYDCYGDDNCPLREDQDKEGNDAFHQCSDWIDNDLDSPDGISSIDCDDSDCYRICKDNEFMPGYYQFCDNGFNDDGSSERSADPGPNIIDCEDMYHTALGTDCWQAFGYCGPCPAYENYTYDSCADGIDNDYDGDIDCDDQDCLGEIFILEDAVRCGDSYTTDDSKAPRPLLDKAKPFYRSAEIIYINASFDTGIYGLPVSCRALCGDEAAELEVIDDENPDIKICNGSVQADFGDGLYRIHLEITTEDSEFVTNSTVFYVCDNLGSSGDGWTCAKADFDQDSYTEGLVTDIYGIPQPCDMCAAQNNSKIDTDGDGIDDICDRDNHRPTHSTPLLSSSYGTDSQKENLTCIPQDAVDLDQDTIKYIYNWYRDGEPILILNMPFEGSSNAVFARDYSAFGNNGTVFNALRSNESGYDHRGAYEFDGNMDYIRIEDSPSLNPAGEISFGGWFRFRSLEESSMLLSKNSYSLYLGGASTEKILMSSVYIDSTRYTVQVSTTMETDRWYHIFTVYDGSEIRIYLDGHLENSHIVAGEIDPSEAPLIIGAKPDMGDHFDGFIDDISIYSTALSEVQISALYRNRTDLIVSDETATGEAWQCSVLPNDGIDDGSLLLSNMLFIHDNIPLTRCQMLDQEQGAYILTADVIDSTEDICFPVKAAGISLDCQGNKIDGIRLAGSYGIYAEGSIDNANNLTIKNCTVTEWGQAGIALEKSSHNLIENINISDCAGLGIDMMQSPNNTVKNSVFEGNLKGIRIAASTGHTISHNQLIGLELDSQQNNLEIIPATAEDCSQTIENVTGIMPIVYYNRSVQIIGWDRNASQIILCNADNSTIDRTIIASHSQYMPAVVLMLTNYSNITNSEFHNEIKLVHSSENLVQNITAEDAHISINASWSERNTIRDSYLNYIYIAFGNENSIYNNFINSTVEVIDSSNLWNTTFAPGINMIGQQNTGGNYWANQDGTGFSETCSDDAPRDGFCDSPMVIDENNLDELPLTRMEPNIAPTHGKPKINSTHGTNYSYENLTCYNISTFDENGDAVINAIRWYINGTEHPELENISTIGFGNTTVGSDWSCSITPSDGFEFGDTKMSVNLTIRATAPWANITYPDGIYEPTCCDGGDYCADVDDPNDVDCETGEPLSNRHLHRFEITFNSAYAAPGDVECDIEVSDGTLMTVSEKHSGAADDPIVLSYVIPGPEILDPAKLSRDKPWLIRACRLYSGQEVFEETGINRMIYVHNNTWTGFGNYDGKEGDGQKALECYLGNKNVYFANEVECDWAGDKDYAGNMMAKGFDLEKLCHNGIDDDGNSKTDCIEDPFCQGIAYNCSGYYGRHPIIAYLPEIGNLLTGAVVAQPPENCGTDNICEGRITVNKAGTVYNVDYAYTQHILPGGRLKVRFDIDRQINSQSEYTLTAMNNVPEFSAFGKYRNPAPGYTELEEDVSSTSSYSTKEIIDRESVDQVMYVDYAGLADDEYEFELVVSVDGEQGPPEAVRFFVDSDAPDNTNENDDSLYQNQIEFIEGTQTSNHRCNDDADNDLDYYIDCRDTDCSGIQIGKAGNEDPILCEHQQELTCYDGFDNDGDGLVDCADSDCLGEIGAYLDGNGVPRKYDTGNQAVYCESPEGSSYSIDAFVCEDRFDNDADSTPYGPSITCSTPQECETRQIDCYDPYECWGKSDTLSSAGEVCPRRENQCTGGADDDHDSYLQGGSDNWLGLFIPDPGLDSTGADCDDYDCRGLGSCPVTEYDGIDNATCFDNIDNDLDQYIWDGDSYALDNTGGIDCNDPDCAGVKDPDSDDVCMSSEFLVNVYGFCTDQEDNDFDFDLRPRPAKAGTDCEDGYFSDATDQTDCWQAFGYCGPCPAYENYTYDSCADGIDNDVDDGLGNYDRNDNSGKDCRDSDCDGDLGSQQGQRCELNQESTCNDNFDNDADNKEDCADADCVSAAGPEGEQCQPNGETLCSDGFDNHNDGRKDCADPQCASSDSCADDWSTASCTVIPYVASGQLVGTTITYEYHSRLHVNDDYTLRLVGSSTYSYFLATIGIDNQPASRFVFDPSQCSLEGPDASDFRWSPGPNNMAGNIQSVADNIEDFDITLRCSTPGVAQPAHAYPLATSERSSEGDLGGSVALTTRLYENTAPAVSDIETGEGDGQITVDYDGYLDIRAITQDPSSICRCQFEVIDPDSQSTLLQSSDGNCRYRLSNLVKEGSYKIRAQARDGAYNLGQEYEETFNIDISPVNNSLLSLIGKQKPFFRSGENIEINVEFIAADVFSANSCNVYIEREGSQVATAAIAATSISNTCICDGMVAAPSGDGMYTIHVSVSDQDGDLGRSARQVFYVCDDLSSSGQGWTCAKADFDQDGATEGIYTTLYGDDQPCDMCPGVFDSGTDLNANGIDDACEYIDECPDEDADNIPPNESCTIYEGFDMKTGCWLIYYNDTSDIVEEVHCDKSTSCEYYLADRTCDGIGGIADADCDNALPNYNGSDTVCDTKTRYSCIGSGKGTSNVTSQTNITKCDGSGNCDQLEAGGILLEQECIWPYYCDDAVCICDDVDKDNVCDDKELPWCIGENLTNLPWDNGCETWEINASGCHARSWLAAPDYVVNVTHCPNITCIVYPWNQTLCGDNGTIAQHGNCNQLDICGDNPDLNELSCRNHFISIGETYNGICSEFGDTNCWDQDAPPADTTIGCCGDDADECWIDNVYKGCCRQGGSGDVIYIDDADKDAYFCRFVGVERALRPDGTNDCSDTIRTYCWAGSLVPFTTDPHSFCCGDDIDETWSTFETSYDLEDVIVDATCKDASWTKRDEEDSTFYDVWGYYQEWR